MSPFRVLYIDVYLFWSAELLRLFGPGLLYEPCFYLDKYGTCIYVRPISANPVTENYCDSIYNHDSVYNPE